MGKNRLEAFSDGVLAILITIMVLALEVPQGASFVNLAGLLPTFVKLRAKLHLSRHLRRRHPALLRQLLGCLRPLLGGGADVAGTGPAHREGCHRQPGAAAVWSTLL